jgi:hypothetical protein
MQAESSERRPMGIHPRGATGPRVGDGVLMVTNG